MSTPHHPARPRRNSNQLDAPRRPPFLIPPPSPIPPGLQEWAYGHEYVQNQQRDTTSSEETMRERSWERRNAIVASMMAPPFIHELQHDRQNNSIHEDIPASASTTQVQSYSFFGFPQPPAEIPSLAIDASGPNFSFFSDEEQSPGHHPYDDNIAPHLFSYSTSLVYETIRNMSELELRNCIFTLGLSAVMLEPELTQRKPLQQEECDRPFEMSRRDSLIVEIGSSNGSMYSEQGSVVDSDYDADDESIGDWQFDEQSESEEQDQQYQQDEDYQTARQDLQCSQFHIDIQEDHDIHEGSVFADDASFHTCHSQTLDEQEHTDILASFAMTEGRSQLPLGESSGTVITDQFNDFDTPLVPPATPYLSPQLLQNHQTKRRKRGGKKHKEAALRDKDVPELLPSLPPPLSPSELPFMGSAAINTVPDRDPSHMPTSPLDHHFNVALVSTCGPLEEQEQADAPESRSRRKNKNRKNKKRRQGDGSSATPTTVQSTAHSTHPPATATSTSAPTVTTSPLPFAILQLGANQYHEISEILNERIGPPQYYANLWDNTEGYIGYDVCFEINGSPCLMGQWDGSQFQNTFPDAWSPNICKGKALMVPEPFPKLENEPPEYRFMRLFMEGYDRGEAGALVAGLTCVDAPVESSLDKESEQIEDIQRAKALIKSVSQLVEAWVAVRSMVMEQNLEEYAHYTTRCFMLSNLGEEFPPPEPPRERRVPVQPNQCRPISTVEFHTKESLANF
ncbi:hypothetical protein BG011_008418 [Mortierella polycephala]|uniref:Uncharacterized protein n=1 Tax=Mortierella polycephala TaxID=41804 RepID=A0A9P6PPX8_9FUNG|nr:hypothetical protein BG011_008418 [Mortierella polycephala]